MKKLIMFCILCFGIMLISCGENIVNDVDEVKLCDAGQECYMEALGGFEIEETNDSIVVINKYNLDAIELYLLLKHNTNAHFSMIRIPIQERVAILKPEISIVDKWIIGKRL